jgi:hypothetical protein
LQADEGTRVLLSHREQARLFPFLGVLGEQFAEQADGLAAYFRGSIVEGTRKELKGEARL